MFFNLPHDKIILPHRNIVYYIGLKKIIATHSVCLRQTSIVSLYNPFNKL